MTTTLPRLVSAKELAADLGLSKFRLYGLVREGLIPAIRIGRSVRFDAEAVAKWLAEGGTGSSSGK